MIDDKTLVFEKLAPNKILKERNFENFSCNCIYFELEYHEILTEW